MTDGLSKGPNPLAALAFGWLIPGAGHVYGGNWGKGVFFFVCIIILLGMGMYLGSGTVFLPNQLWFFPQLVSGGPGLALWPISIYFARPARHRLGRPPARNRLAVHGRGGVPQRPGHDGRLREAGPSAAGPRKRRPPDGWTMV